MYKQLKLHHWNVGVPLFSIGWLPLPPICCPWVCAFAGGDGGRAEDGGRRGCIVPGPDLQILHHQSQAGLQNRQVPPCGESCVCVCSVECTQPDSRIPLRQLVLARIHAVPCFIIHQFHFFCLSILFLSLIHPGFGSPPTSTLSFFLLLYFFSVSISVFPLQEDYRRTVSEIDEKEYISLKIIVSELRNQYVSIVVVCVHQTCEVKPSVVTFSCNHRGNNFLLLMINDWLYVFPLHGLWPQTGHMVWLHMTKFIGPGAINLKLKFQTF